ncbi:MAG: hypothetical protein H6739_03825 [Alphaproteobacteria bacterium]|nr:hypothetical protein [Alphaproteobacteria bacterium]
MRWTLLLLAGCGAAYDAEPMPSPTTAMEAEQARRADTGVADNAAPARKKGRASWEASGGAPQPPGAPPAAEPAPEDDAVEEEIAAMDGKDAGGGDGAGVPTRAWFPETFLWEPAVVTDANGHAELTVTVPDTLTTWRVLALAASREGAQAGDVHRFSSTLPVYVDPVLPPWLRMGDEVVLPVQVVNTTGDDVTAQLQVATAGLVGAGGGAVRIPAYGSALETVRVRAPRPGPASLTASLGADDRIQRTLDVEPVGRKVSQSRAGLLGSEDAVELITAADAEYARVRLVLYPGPLGVLRSELAVAGARGGTVANSAYAFALGARGEALLTALGAEVDDPDALRATRLRAQQGLVRATRAPSTDTAAMVLYGLKGGQPDAVAERLAARLHRQLLDAQLPDGSWPVPPGTLLQQLIANTAFMAWLLDDPAATVRASAVVERYADRLIDPDTGDAYTAALVLRAGLGTAETKALLREQIEAALAADGVGDARVALPSGVRGILGGTPSSAEVEATVAQVLEGAPAAELAASVIARYQPGRGFGDGLAGLAALDALAKLGERQLPESLDVVLRVDGEEVERHTLRGAALAETAVLTAPAPLAGSHRYEVTSDGAWPGLAWHLDLDTWVPWDAGAGPEGLEVEVAHGVFRKGQPVDVTLTVAGPDDEALVVSHSLPAGFTLDERSVQGAIVKQADDDVLTVEIASGHGGMTQVRFQAVPTLSGALSTGPATVALSRKPDLVATAPPQRWTVP